MEIVQPTQGEIFTQEVIMIVLWTAPKTSHTLLHLQSALLLAVLLKAGLMCGGGRLGRRQGRFLIENITTSLVELLIESGVGGANGRV